MKWPFNIGKNQAQTQSTFSAYLGTQIFMMIKISYDLSAKS